uniref:hypothetical protein n=1 Tax=Ferrovum sp. TaxID=2609467 RepID=UPI00261014FD
GVLFASIIGISSAITSYSGRDKQMVNEKSKQSTVAVFDSVNGMASLKESFNGAAKLKPQQPVAQQAIPTSVPHPAQNSNSNNSGTTK